MSSQLGHVGAPSSETARLEALHEYALRDPGAWPELEALLRLLCRVTQLPFATLNVIDAEHQLQPCAVGFEGAATPRADSMCARHFMQRELVQLSDATLDPVFADSPWVDGRQDAVRHYVSLPLVTAQGHVVGTLCTFDRRPGVLDEHQLAAVADLGRLALALLEQRRLARRAAQHAADAGRKRLEAEEVSRELEARQQALRATQELLATSERRFRSMFEDSPVAMGLSDENGQFIAANDALCRLFGRPRRELLGSSAQPFTHPDDVPLQARSRELIAEAGDQVVRLERRYVRPDGDVRWGWLSLSRVSGPNGEDWVLAHIQDITDNKRSEQELEDSRAVLSAIAEVARCGQSGTDPRPVLVRAVQALLGTGSVALVEPDADELVVTACAGAATVGVRTGQTSSSATALCYTSGERVFVADVLASVIASNELADLSGTRAVLCEPVTSSGRVVAVLVVGWDRVLDELDPRLAALVTTLADEASAALSGAVLREQLEALAVTDPLTGLANRRGWYERLEVMSADARREDDLLTLAIADLDHFKRFNDSHGHEAGDVLLRDFAQTAVEVLREGDLLARWGGEEFAIALPGSDEVDAEAALERLRLAVPGGQTCSFGLATWDGVESLTSCLARADQALYRAKTGGRNRISR